VSSDRNRSELMDVYLHAATGLRAPGKTKPKVEGKS
jgi:hypothetical protein